MIDAAGRLQSSPTTRVGPLLLVLSIVIFLPPTAVAQRAAKQKSTAAADKTAPVDTDTVIVSGAPQQKSRIRRLRSLLLGKAHEAAVTTGDSEVWIVPKSQTSRVARRLEKLGAKVTRLREDWNHILKRHRGPVSPEQQGMLDRMRSSPETVGVGVLKAPEAPLSGYALTGPDHKPEPLTWPPKEKSASTVVLPVSPTQNITLQRDRVVATPGGYTWSGVVQETGERALLMWWKDGHLSGLVGYKGRIYTVMNIGGDVHAMVEMDPLKLPPDHAKVSSARLDTSRLGDNASSTQPALERSTPLPAPPEVKPLADTERAALEAKKITIDVMILYTRKAASHYIRDPGDLIALALEQANETFRNSGVGNIALRLVHTEMIDYDESVGEHFEHLYRVVDGVGPFKDVRKLRDEKRADIVGMVMDDPSGCGLSTRVGAGADEAYFVVHHSCAAITISIAHEIGHILGARHDRRIDASNAPFAYGHGFVNGTKWRDVMSYPESCEGCPRIPFWSNPRVTYKGEPTGTLTEDNARVILEQAERVSRFR